MKNHPKPLADADPAELADIQAVAFDVDDTFTSEGLVTEEAYSALWALKRAGYALVPITGGPAGWCHHFARCWPVDAVVGENGAFTFHRSADGRLKTLISPAGMDEDDRRTRLQNLRDALLEFDPQLTFASDQSYRDYDLAIDYCQDVEPWDGERIARTLALCHEHGAQARRSSIHINTWFGDFSKDRGFRWWLEQAAGPDRAVPFSNWAYVGDSPNDEPMFAEFKRSCGVANLGHYIDELEHLPTWITAQEAGAGFSEFARALLAARGRSQA